MLDKDTGATIAGGGAGYLLLQSVKWEQVGAWPPTGEAIKVGVALAMILGGYLAYRRA